MIQIKRNAPSMYCNDVVRENVVQAICDSFLSNNIYAIFRYMSEGCYRPITNLVYCDGSGFTCKDNNHYNKPTFEFSRGEMKKAFEILLENGYYMFKLNSGYKGYYCSNTSISEFNNTIRVNNFNDWD